MNFSIIWGWELKKRNHGLLTFSRNGWEEQPVLAVRVAKPRE